MIQGLRWWDLGLGHLLSILTVLLTLVFVTVLLRARRPPASTLTWLLIVIFVPYLGIPLFLIFGIRKFRQKQQGRPLSSPLSSNRELRFLTSGEDAYYALMESIAGANSEIALTTFILARDETGKAILKELTRKASEGVKVRLLLDSWGSSIFVRPSLKAFQRAGGEVAFFMPLLHLPFQGQDNLRNHRKMAIFDGTRAWFGGMNLAREYMGPSPEPKRWTDLAVWIEGESVKALAAIFERDWNFAKGSPYVPKERGSQAAPFASHIAQVVGSGPDCPGDPIYDALLEACYHAHSRIWILTPYFVPDESLNKALTLAKRRGVDVRIGVPKISNHFFADLCRGSYLRSLIDEGAEVHFFPRMNHAKMVLIDDHFCLVGSANFDLRSLFYNYEVGVFLSSAEDIQRATEWILELFAVSDRTIPKASPFRELGEGVGRLFGPLL